MFKKKTPPRSSALIALPCFGINDVPDSSLKPLLSLRGFLRETMDIFPSFFEVLIVSDQSF